MIPAETISENSCWFENEHDILPMMTSFFVNGLESENNCPIDTQDYTSKKLINREAAKIFRLPIAGRLDGRRSNKIKKINESHDLIIRIFKNYTPSSRGQQTIMRQLIGGISHHFNNLLMGIWGNATLIRMQLDPKDPQYMQVEQMERLIQSGAFLIHMVLGYLGERRTVAKQIRLNQLISEIRSQAGIRTGIEDPWNFESCLKWANSIQRPKMIASSTSRVFNVLFSNIKKICKSLITYNVGEESGYNKIQTILSLIGRGIEITNKMRFYAADLSNAKKRPTSITVLVDNVTSKIIKYYPNIHLKTEINKSSPKIKIDRLLVEQALEEVLQNAVYASDERGKIEVFADELNEMPAKERWGVKRPGSCIVIAVYDYGCGLSSSIRNKIFEPFFSHPASSKRLGLGLSAADGILKFHEGYLLQQSLQNRNVFKLYLPYKDS